MVVSQDECLRHANACTRWAAESKNERDREILLEIAKIWTQMALRDCVSPVIMQSDDESEAKPPIQELHVATPSLVAREELGC
jgi:hypothetical protein